MKLEKTPGGYALYKEKTIIGTCQARPTEQGADIAALTIVPEWRRKGYGSYLLKEVLRSLGGYDNRERHGVHGSSACRCRRSWPSGQSSALRQRGSGLVPPPHPRPDGREASCRTSSPRGWLTPGSASMPPAATGATRPFSAALWAKEGRVLGFDIQPEAIASTRQHLDTARASRQSFTATATPTSYSMYSPAPADAVMFNFGWLPGADHGVFSHAPTAASPRWRPPWRPCGPAACSAPSCTAGKVIGTDEKTDGPLDCAPGTSAETVSPFWCAILPIGPKPPPCPASS